MSRFLILFFSLFSASVFANWHKVGEADYTWGPFKIYHIALFSETGEYVPTQRPLMLTLNYNKPVDGRDFAISLARSWSNLGITLPEQEDVIDRLRKTLPDLKPEDSLSYIALQDKGYFVLNDTILPEEFNLAFNDAILAIWLDPRVDLSHQLITAPQTTDAEKRETPAAPTANEQAEQPKADVEQSQPDVERAKPDAQPASELDVHPEKEVQPISDPQPKGMAPVS